MGSCLPKGNNATTKSIDNKMKENEKYENALIKLLFLGPGGSGKSTIFKQLQWLYSTQWFSPKDIIVLKQRIYSQMIVQMQDAIKFYLSEPIENEQLTKSINIIRSCECTDTLLTNEIANSIKYIWTNDVRLSDIFRKHHTKKILDESTEYFWNKIDMITTADYEPTKSDIMNIRNRTTGIIQKQFTINKLSFHIFDVGGQKSERKKWINCFDNVKACVFVVSLACYNETMFEDDQKNCMSDALELFDKTINNSHFLSTPIILFLNKKDLFENKIKDLPITMCHDFADFGSNGDMSESVYISNNPNDYIQTTSFIKNTFESLNSNERKRSIYSHITCAMDDKNIGRVFNDVAEIVFKEISKGFTTNHLL